MLVIAFDGAFSCACAGHLHMQKILFLFLKKETFIVHKECYMKSQRVKTIKINRSSMEFSFTFGKTSRGSINMWSLEKTIDFPIAAEGIRIGRENNNEKRFHEQTITTHIKPNLFTYDFEAMSR